MLHENSVFCLMVSRDGTLWIGTEGGGIVRYAAWPIPFLDAAEAKSNDFVRVLVQDPRRHHLGRHR